MSSRLLAARHGVDAVVPRPLARRVSVQVAALVHKQLQNAVGFAVGLEQELPQRRLVHVRDAAHLAPLRARGVRRHDAAASRQRVLPHERLHYVGAAEIRRAALVHNAW